MPENPNKRPFKNASIAVVSLVATPLLLFLSTSNILYQNNQDELGHQFSVLFPFFGFFLVTLTLGVILWLQAGKRAFRILLWAYYLVGPTFLVFSLLRDIPVAFLDEPIGSLVFFAFSLGIILVTAKRHHPDRTSSYFAVFSVILMLGDTYRFVSGFEWKIEREQENVTASNSDFTGNRTRRPNIYHILFDGFQSDIFSLILSRKLESSLGGFVYYPETTASYSHTTWSVPSVFLGAPYDFASSQMEYQNRAFNSDSSILYALRKAGYFTVAYTRKLYPIKLKLFDKTAQHINNMGAGNQVNNGSAFRSLWLYRYVPKFATEWFVEHGLFLERHDLARFKMRTFLAHSATIESLLSLKQYLIDEKDLPESGRYTFIHLLIPHSTKTYNADCKKQKPTTVQTSSQCAARLITDIVNRLKELGRFNKSLVIIHGDHGDTYSVKNGVLTPMKFRSPRTLLLVKPSGVTDTRAFKVSKTETTLLDIAPTLWEFVGHTPNSLHEGISLLGVTDSSPTRNRKYYTVQKDESLMDQYTIAAGTLKFDKSIKLTNDRRIRSRIEPTSIPIFATDRVIEAEAGYLSSATDTGSNIRSTVGSYITSGNAYFRFKIEKDGVFRLRARMLTPSGNNDSSFVRINDGKKELWNLDQSNHWKWQEYPVQLNLSAGTHLLSIEYREPVYLDQVELKKQ